MKDDDEGRVSAELGNGAASAIFDELEAAARAVQEDLDPIADRLWSLSVDDPERAALLRELSRIVGDVGVVLMAALEPDRDVVSLAGRLHAVAADVRDAAQALRLRRPA